MTAHNAILTGEPQVSMPEIYYDEPEPAGKDEAWLGEFSVSAAATLAALEKLLTMLDSRRDWKIVRLRARGLSYPSIANQLGIGVATVVRLMRKIEMHNPELGYLLTHVGILHKEEENQ